MYVYNSDVIKNVKCSGPSLKGHLSNKDRIIGKYYGCLKSSLSPKDTPLMRTELFDRRGVLTRGVLLCTE